MLLWMDQPAAYSTSTFNQRWTDWRSGGPAVSTSITPRVGAASLNLPATDFFIRKKLGLDGGPTPSGARAILGMLFRCHQLAVLGVCAVENDASPQISLRMDAGGTLSVVRGVTTGTVLGTTVAAMDANVFYEIWLNVLIHGSTGTVDLYLNEVNVLSLTGQNTQALGSAVWNSFSLGESASAFSSTFHYWSDIIAMDGVDGTGVGQRLAFNTPLLGRKVEYLPSVTGNGANADSTPSSGSDRGAMVDESGPDGDTTYNELVDDADRDTYGITDLSGTVNVDAVAPLFSARRADAGNRQLQPVLRIGGTNYFGTAVDAPLHAAYRMVTEIITASPATTNAFTQSEVNGLEAGPGIPA